MAERELDVVLFGASGFVGRLVAEHLARRDLGSLKIGLGGRSRDRLADVGAALGVDWPLVIADSADSDSLTAMANRARVVVSTVGPYIKYGLPLVEACATAGTDYADLTGEVLFVRECIDRYDEVAVGSGARIVHACGFDSVPSDLGVQMLADRASADNEGELAEVLLVVASMKAGISGGSVDSLRAQVDAVSDDPSLRRLMSDPYALSPDRAAEPDLGSQSDRFVAEQLGDGTWVAPFVMASFNSRIVRRSNALQGHAYGRDLRYREVIRTGKSPVSRAAAVALAAGTSGLALGLRTAQTRPLLDRLLPDPGTGPSEAARRRGHFKFELRARTTTGAQYIGVVEAWGDPGYAATSVMIGESALCLAVDRDRLPKRSGILTPATAFGSVLAQRLRDNGFRLDVQPVKSPRTFARRPPQE